MAGKRKKTPFQRAEFRQERLLRDQHALKELRKHFTGYESRDGFDLHKVESLTYSQRRSIRNKYAKVRKLLSQPFTEIVTPKSADEAKALRRFTHERMRGMKHFIVQKPSAEARVELVEDQVQIRTRFPGEAEYTVRYYMFERRPRSPDHMLKMLDRMLPGMPKDGAYTLLTDTYGETGAITDYKKVRSLLSRYLNAYDDPKYKDNRFLYRIVGVRWFQTQKEGIEVKHGRDEQRDRVREYNRNEREALEAEARKRARRLTRK